MLRGAPLLPAPRGPATAALVERLRTPPHSLPTLPPPLDDPLSGDDAQLALYLCYELHYRSFRDVDDGWEWEPSLLAHRGGLEAAFEERLWEEVGTVDAPHDVEHALQGVIEEADGPSLSGYLCREGSLGQVREAIAHRSAYQLKEADPHTWAIPRLGGGPKAALIEIQVDEYGGGVEADMHASLFATTMEAVGLDCSYGAYLDRLPGPTLATANLVSMLGLHRRWRGALVGHLAIFEATSVAPMGRYQEALRRLGIDREAQRFYEVHVQADAQHEVVAMRDLAGGLAATEPALAMDILFGARALMLVEERFARHVLGAWSAGRTSLLHPLPPVSAAAV